MRSNPHDVLLSNRKESDVQVSATDHTRQGKSPLTCRICGSQAEVFFELRGIPVCCNVLWPSREKAINAPKGDLQLAFCRECGHIYNAAFDPAQLSYGTNYDNSLHFSPRFQEYAGELAARLVTTYDLHKKTVIEIGCGSAEFLALLCALGPNRGIGFDPSFIPGRADLNSGEGIEIVADNYSERYADRSCDLLCSRHMLEHVPDPLAIVISVMHALRGNRHAAVYFEVPNALFTLEEKGVWDIIYEHCSYFTPQSIRRLFEETGFGIRNVRESFGRQFLSLEAVVSGPIADQRANEHDSRLIAEVAAFSAYRKRLFDDWNVRFEKMRRAGQRPVVWGAGAKGTTFLNAFGEHGLVEYVVDINPNKHGRYIAGTGQKILAPSELQLVRPDVIVLMNPIYINEVEQQAEAVGVSCPVVSA